MTEPLRGYKLVSKVQTLADGTVRVSFDYPEGAAFMAATLIVCQEEGAIIDYVYTPRMPDDSTDIWDGVSHAD